LRVKVLEIFDGMEWRPASKQISRAENDPGSIKIEIFREPMRTDILPVPYGTTTVTVKERKRQKYQSGEWLAVSQHNRRIQYEVTVGGSRGVSDDLPKKVHMAKPDPERFPGLTALARDLVRGARTDEEKVRKVMLHLERYKASLSPMSSAEAGNRHPVEIFLFDTKEGHCELFASSAALLFRAFGMPSRLVAGFRGALPDGSVLSLKNTDAHAWVEVWTRDKGWIALDPTPILEQSSLWSDKLSEAYDYLNAYWHRYILGYEFDSRAIAAWLKAKKIPWVASAFLVVVALFLLISGARRKRKPNELNRRIAVTKAWERLERRTLKLRAAHFFQADEGKKISARYLQLRFGQNLPTNSEVSDFERAGHLSIQNFASAREHGK